MLLPAAVARSAIACVAALSLSCSPLQLAPAAAAAPPSAESQSALQKAFQSAQAGSYASADTQLGKLILEWEKTGQPDDETAALYKTRGVCRQSLGQLPAAREDLSQALRLSMTPGSKPDPAEVQRTYQLRARVNQKLGNSREQAEDLTAAITRLDQLDAIEATNPQLFKDRAEARMRTKEWAGAAEDAERAQIEFKQLGDKIRALVSAADGALALYSTARLGVASPTPTLTCTLTRCARALRRGRGARGDVQDGVCLQEQGHARLQQPGRYPTATGDIPRPL